MAKKCYIDYDECYLMNESRDGHVNGLDSSLSKTLNVSHRDIEATFQLERSRDLEPRSSWTFSV